MRFRWPWVACLVLTAGQASAACQLGAVAVLPLRMVGGHAMFDADVNGMPANLVLDTGSFATMLTRSSAERLGVSMSETGADSNGVGGSRAIWRGRARHMRVGNINADGMTLAGSDFLDREGVSGPDGLFGMNMMAAYDIDLDLVGQHAIIFEADGDCHKPAVALSPPLYDVHLVHVDNNRAAEVDIGVDGESVRAEIDTGSPHTVMFRAAAYRLGIDVSGLHAAGHQMIGGVGPRKVAAITHVFGKVVIGDLTISNMPVDIIDQAVVTRKRVHLGSLLTDDSDGEGGGEDMLIGADFMQKVHLWISHSSQRLIMQFPPQPSVLPK